MAKGAEGNTNLITRLLIIFILIGVVWGGGRLLISAAAPAIATIGFAITTTLYMKDRSKSLTHWIGGRESVVIAAGAKGGADKLGSQQTNCLVYAQ